MIERVVATVKGWLEAVYRKEGLMKTLIAVVVVVALAAFVAWFVQGVLGWSLPWVGA